MVHKLLEDEQTYFDRERDRLSSEIASVSFYSPSDKELYLNGNAGLRASPHIVKPS